MVYFQMEVVTFEFCTSTNQRFLNFHFSHFQHFKIENIKIARTSFGRCKKLQHHDFHYKTIYLNLKKCSNEVQYQTLVKRVTSGRF